MAEIDIMTNLNGIRVSGYQNLNVKAKAYYRQKCKELLDLGELRRQYLLSIMLWAEALDRYRSLSDAVKEEGYTFETTNKYGQRVFAANPKVKMMNDALGQVTGFAKEFGGTKKQAHKMNDAPKGKKNELDEWTND